MGSRIFCALDVSCDSQVTDISSLAQWFEAWEQEFSRFRPTSELSKLNLTRNMPVRVSEDFWDVAMQARHAEELSQGLVTPVIERAMIATGYISDFKDIGEYLDGIGPPARPCVRRISDLILDADQHMIQIQTDTQFDFGGIAKGWSAHQAALKLNTIGPALVNAGGDIAISAPQRDGSAWLIGVSDPLVPSENVAMIHVRCGGVATSGIDYRNWIRSGISQHHIIDPRTGEPAVTDVLSATVIAPNVMDAETHARTTVILGSVDGLSWLESHTDVAGLLVLQNGQILLTQNMNEYLRREHVSSRPH